MKNMIYYYFLLHFELKLMTQNVLDKKQKNAGKINGPEKAVMVLKKDLIFSYKL